MIVGYSATTQALLGTLLTWGLTAAGSGLVFFMSGTQRKFLDASLGFAAGVMLAASYWSLLAPAIELAESSGSYGSEGEFAYVPVALGFLLGAIFVYGADLVVTHFQVGSVVSIAGLVSESEKRQADRQIVEEGIPLRYQQNLQENQLTKRNKGGSMRNEEDCEKDKKMIRKQEEKWKRILLLVIAITVHNVPEGLAVGVGFGAVGKSSKATFESARNLAIGIGIQNFPEGLAVSLPLRGSGLSIWKSFWYGQLSGLVEPFAGLLGVLCVSWIEPSLPYALSFAAGAMVYVVFDDLIPEASTCGNGRLASWGAILGFVVMMCLDVGLG